MDKKECGDELHHYLHVPLFHISSVLDRQCTGEEYRELMSPFSSTLAFSEQLFELRLQQKEGELDVSFYVERQNRAKEDILGCNLDPQTRGAERLRRAFAFLHQTSLSSPDLWKCIEGIWFEFDADTEVPGLFCEVVTGRNPSLQQRVIEKRWPQELSGRYRKTWLWQYLVAARWLNHLKIGVEGNKPIEAKAYLGSRYVWINRGSGEVTSLSGTPPPFVYQEGSYLRRGAKEER